MSKDRRNDLDAEVNRYLDGDISESEFEVILSGLDEAIDLEKFRSLKSRVLRIEELYRQLEEPGVPADYWESFADRVAEKLPAAETTPLSEKILNILFPWRWPAAAFSYAGAVASVVLIFMIGKSVQEGGQHLIEPDRVQSLQEHRRIEVQSVSPLSAVDKSIDRSAMHESEVPPPAEAIPETDQFIAEEKSVESEVADIIYDSDLEKSTAEGGVSENVGAGKVTVTLDEESVDPELTSSTDAVRQRKGPGIETALDIPEPVAAPKVDRDKPTLTQIETEDHIADAMDQQQLAFSAIRAAGRAGTAQDDSVVWRYDNWNLNDLRSELKLYEAILGDSLFESNRFLEYTGMKSSVAIMTRDSVDIYDAVNTIDTLLKYNPQADPRFWEQRRNQLESIIPIPPGP